MNHISTTCPAALLAVLLAMPPEAPATSVTQTAPPQEVQLLDLNMLPRQGKPDVYLGYIQQSVEAAKEQSLPKRSEQRLDDMEGRIAKILSDYDNLDQIPLARREKVLESQKIIHDIIANRRSNDWVCTSAAPTGSRLSKVQCATREDLDLSRRGSREWTEKMQQVGCLPGEGNCS